jgi:hypothetical protein
MLSALWLIYVLAMICFGLAALGVQSRLALQPLGLMLIAMALALAASGLR